MSFHLSLPVKNLEKSRTFFVDILRAAVVQEDARGYINLELHGTQLTLHEKPTMTAASTDMHFGINLPVEEFEEIVALVQAKAADCIKVKPTVVDAGTSRERHKMFLQCPAGYLIEVKGVRA